ncbi:hypothetical protein EC973_002778 [Apophysomyces ossiformis]|uniref:Sulfate transporter n=1 Tax=Apophysomyces ossiformis TaxID=679940 RepID=A0A8H7BQY1_9FUNG|nr:hypothetical protein EC973_002778 [Apophysomyces ossiformis]
MISLAVAGQINLTSTLWFAGIWNILSGLLFQVPVCVQPMKAIAAVVLSSNMTLAENMSAGLGCSTIVFFLGITRTIHIVDNYTPRAIIRGLQLGTGMQLIKKAFPLVSKLQWQITAANWADNYPWVLLSTVFVFACYRTRVPSALILFLIGLLFALIRMFVTDKHLPLPHPVAGGHYPDTIVRPTPEEFRTGFVSAGLGQIPLTTLNSVIALCALIDDLFPEKHASTARVAVSVGAMNLIGCWFGAMPVCHGAGGLAGQYRFGARSELSVILLGTCKLLLGIIFGSSLVGLLELFPNSILAVMLFVSGVELASAARAITFTEGNVEVQKDAWTLMMTTAGALVAFGNDGIGFLTGLVVAILLALQRLGVRVWCVQTIQAIRELPQKWRDQQTLQQKRLPTHSEPASERDVPESSGASIDSTKPYATR